MSVYLGPVKQASAKKLLRRERGHLGVADQREVQEDDVILGHGEVVLHGGVLQCDVKVLPHHATLADCKVVQHRFAEAVAESVEEPCSQAST